MSRSDQFDRLAEIEWDILIVLDATRWDVWEEMIGTGEPVTSPASCTKAWVARLLYQTDMSDVDCITANPEVTRRALRDSFQSRDDIWERGWEYVDGLGTVPPETVTKAVESKHVVGPSNPIYAHYAQPHGPYPKHDPPIPVMRNNPDASDVDLDDDELPAEIIMNPREILADPESWLTVEMLRDAYRSNLMWAVEAIQPLLDLDATVVVTSDHGEILGETISGEKPDGEMVTHECFYGHPCGLDHPTLRTVPLAVYD